eukprot:7789452-Heterocapsa_arctica.AAC.1
MKPKAVLVGSSSSSASTSSSGSGFSRSSWPYTHWHYTCGNIPNTNNQVHTSRSVGQDIDHGPPHRGHRGPGPGPWSCATPE